MASRKKSVLFGATCIAGLCGFAAWADIGPFTGGTPRGSVTSLGSIVGGIVKSNADVAIPEVAMSPPLPGSGQKTLNVDGLLRTNMLQPVIAVTTRDAAGKVIDQDGTVTILINGAKVDSVPVVPMSDGTDGRYRVDLGAFQNTGQIQISAQWAVEVLDAATNKTRTFSRESESITVEVDTRGPALQTIDLDEENKQLRLKFDTDNLHASAAVPGHYRIYHLDGDLTRRIYPGKDEITVTADGPHGKYVVLTLHTDLVKEDGDYAIEVTRSVTDSLGNRAGQRELQKGVAVYDEQIKRYSIFGERKTGPHVEFPDFVERQRVPSDKVFNPGDSVETRVVRLYYFRDAHRVAQILNRNVKQYNKAGVDRAVRTAGQAREAAESATDDRKRSEKDAIEAATERRRVERELRQAERALEERQSRLGRIGELNGELARQTAEIARLETLITATQEELNALPASETDTVDKAELEAQKFGLRKRKKEHEDNKAALTLTRDELTKEKTLLETGIKHALERVNKLEEDFEAKRVEESAKRRKMEDAETKEDRAVEHQFRADVAAAKEDPDTYVPADIMSVDAVTQVSISVIGEGLIQLRGPIRGINQIRTMVNQIDSPVGQVKVGIFTVQVNGEHADRMEDVATKVEGHIDLSRFLTNYSLGLIRRCVQEVASETISQVDHQFGGHGQSDRDRRYVYAFFGRDFVDELFEMESEFLRTENKLLSLHAMDTVSLSQAMFILALAKNDIRERILNQFMAYVDSEVPNAEWDFRQAAELKTKKMKKAEKLDKWESKLPWMESCGARSIQEVARIVHAKYRFRNFRGFFTASAPMHSDAMTPLQREFIRLAQIFKSTMLAEMELKQRIVERGLIQQYVGDEDQALQETIRTHQEVERKLAAAANDRQTRAANVKVILDSLIGEATTRLGLIVQLDKDLEDSGVARLLDLMGPSKGPRAFRFNDTTDIPDKLFIKPRNHIPLELTVTDTDQYSPRNAGADRCLDVLKKALGEDTSGDPREQGDERNYFDLNLSPMTVQARQLWRDTFRKLVKRARACHVVFSQVRFTAERQQTYSDEGAYLNYLECQIDTYKDCDLKFGNVVKVVKILFEYRSLAAAVSAEAARIRARVQLLLAELSNPSRRSGVIEAKISQLRSSIFNVVKDKLAEKAQLAFLQIDAELQNLSAADLQLEAARQLERQARVDLDHKKLLDYLIDEKREKWIELAEGTRSHIASVDNYLKRLSIALEDDFKVQFYDPAFRGVRGAATSYDVNLGQVERTTILTNNRALAIVRPQATMEFDLPKRSPVIVEAMSGAQALMQDYGTLLQDPTFVGLTGMLGGTPVVGNPQQRLGSPAVRTVVPGLDTQAPDQVLAASGGPNRKLGSAIENLIPEPAIYKFETGTGFQIRPVIQPDGHSVIYNFNYMYTTNVREPVAADEKHLGRIKRHFIDTEVQTSSFELREISRYQVALKASRTSRGVPLLEDVPGVGVLFRPLPSDESSLQQNIILGHTTVYPTLFDLMGLRWSRHVADLDHMELRNAEHVIRGRNRVINNFVFDRTSDEVDDFLGIKEQMESLYRPDLYREQGVPSPYHPSGYVYPGAVDSTTGEPKALVDPTGRNFHQKDPRPVEARQAPVYDSLRRGPIDEYGTGREVIPSPAVNEDLRDVPPMRVGSEESVYPEVRQMSHESPTTSPTRGTLTPVPDKRTPGNAQRSPQKRSLFDRLLRRNRDSAE